MRHHSAPGGDTAPMLTEPSDKELLSYFLDGDNVAAFETLIKRHALMVRNVCWHQLHHKEDAEDAFQQTILVVMRKAASINNGGAFKGWLYRVADRTAKDVRKSRSRRKKHECPCDEETQITQITQIGDYLRLKELVSIIDEEVQHLPEKYRLPFVLHCLEDKSETETAAELGLTKGQVAGRLRKAREFLLPKLARRGIYPPGQQD